MKFDRAKNASRNIVFGLIQRIYQLLVPFAMRTAMIYWLGVEYLGLDGLFTSILSVLNLAELGIGSAMVYKMYKPVAEDDKNKICALMRLYKYYYRIIGFVVLLGGILITPFIPKLISSDLPEGINVYALYFLNLFATVLSYWLFAYKNSILQAYQRNDVVSKITMAVSSCRYLIQFLVLFLLHDYYIYLIVTLVTQVVINVTTAIISNRLFPGLNPEGDVTEGEKKEINQSIRDLFTAKIGGVVVNSVDTIVISAFLGLTVLAIYQNYYYIITALISIISIFIYSCTAGIGNSIIVETKEKNFLNFKTHTFIIAWLGTFCTSCLVCVFQPFMQIWVGNDLMFDFPAAVCFAIYFFIVQLNTLFNNYKDAAGIWHEDRFRPLITAIVNLCLNLLFVHILGVYGILLSTLLSMLFVGIPWLMNNLFSTIFDKKCLKEYVILLFFYIFAAMFVVVISHLLGSFVPFDGILIICTRVIICGIISLFTFFILFKKTIECRIAFDLIDKITKYKFKLANRFLK